jgi:hypothetical protein
VLLLQTSIGRDINPIIISIAPLCPKKVEEIQILSIDFIQRRQYRTVVKGKKSGVKFQFYNLPSMCYLASYLISVIFRFFSSVKRELTVYVL